MFWNAPFLCLFDGIKIHQLGKSNLKYNHIVFRNWWPCCW